MRERYFNAFLKMSDIFILIVRIIKVLRSRTYLKTSCYVFHFPLTNLGPCNVKRDISGIDSHLMNMWLINYFLFSHC